MLLSTANNIIKHIRKYFKHFDVVGSIGRKEYINTDIDILIYERDLDELINSVDELILIKKNKNRAIADIVFSHKRYKLDIFLCNEDNYIFMKFMLESPKSYNIRVRNLAKTKGYKLSQYGLYKIVNNREIPVKIQSEADIFDILGITHRSIYNRD
jgi:DNA polymerase (family 10)